MAGSSQGKQANPLATIIVVFGAVVVILFGIGMILGFNNTMVYSVFSGAGFVLILTGLALRRFA